LTHITVERVACCAKETKNTVEFALLTHITVVESSLLRKRNKYRDSDHGDVGKGKNVVSACSFVLSQHCAGTEM
jgi:hypothetical protein